MEQPPKVDWTTPCCMCGGTADRVIYGTERNSDPSIIRYYCKPCEDRVKDKQH